MRVFLLMALVMPLLDAAVWKLSPLMLLAALATLYILQNAACAAIDHESRDALTFFVRDYLLYLTGYSISSRYPPSIFFGFSGRNHPCSSVSSSPARV